MIHRNVQVSQATDTLLKKYSFDQISGHIDVFAEGIMMPDLAIGDIILGLNMGAYSAATTTDFNMFPRAKIVLV